ncbi:glycosyltransferase [Halopiger djelfimassiliensis]|uniref:glycosyltransferase n=1 Tax=Halopiger djelfimassiliensis TaxID=1293047 RepID=UPI0018A8310A|nr:glycosyltransferase [Halopiger djelfimassiliensis]
MLLGDYDYDYPRETNIREGLNHHDVEVVDCQFSEKQRFIGPLKALLMPLFFVRIVRRMRTIRRDHDPDAIFVTKFNPLVLPLAWVYARKIGCPLVYDLFVSLHRTAEMRDVHPLLVKLVYLLEYGSLRLPDYHTVGTNQFIELYSSMYSLPKHRFIRLPPGADEEWYYPLEKSNREEFTALYWGNFLPHHGVETIIDAAEILQRRDVDDVSIVFVGTGPRKEWAEAAVEKRGLDNVQFEGFVEMDVLQNWIATSHVCLGVFSSDKRAMASITNKVSEGVAMAKAVITERSPAIEEWFEHEENIYLVPPDDGDALAEAILDCKENPALIERLEEESYEVFESAFSQEEIGRILVAELSLRSNS